MAAALVGFVASLVLGTLAAVVLAVRAQLAILTRFPGADWPALAAGLGAGGLVLILTVAVAFGLPSPRRALLLLALPGLLLAAGGLAVTGFPRAGFRSPELRSEWSQLSPALRVSLWIAHLAQSDPVVVDVGGDGDPSEGSQLARPVSYRGYGRAVDLRAGDAGEGRDWARQGVFLLLGLRAERRLGADDLLRVSMP